MKKKSIAILLTVFLTIGSITGCGSASYSSSDKAVACEDAALSEGYAEYYYEEAPAEQAIGGGYNEMNGYAEEAKVASGYENDSYYNSETYKEIKENDFTSVAENPLSTFSADVDTASYANMRRMIREGYDMDSFPKGSIRTEELINYFDYQYAGPRSDEPFGVNAVISDCPWNADSKLLMMGLQTEEIPADELPSSNIVFLIDTSGSMYSEDKLPLLQQAFEMLVEEGLDENDRVSIVTYAGSSDVVLQGVPGNRKNKIINALYSLEAGGSTNGSEGIMTAYRLAEEYFIENGNNRVIIASDGDMNVGLTSEEELRSLIEEKRKSGVFLSVLGFGTGNYQDDNMEALADSGNGNYSYIDCLSEAKKVLVDELSATLLTVAKDVKFQIEFNPAVVSKYRLIGYENRVLNTEDFEDDTKDAGEIGAGHSVTVMYELSLQNPGNNNDTELRYQESKLTDRALNTEEWFTLAIRYKKPDEDESRLLEYPIGLECYTTSAPDDFYFAASVAELGMILNDSDYLADGSIYHITQTIDDLKERRFYDESRSEFYELVEMLYSSDDVIYEEYHNEFQVYY